MGWFELGLVKRVIYLKIPNPQLGHWLHWGKALQCSSGKIQNFILWLVLMLLVFTISPPAAALAARHYTELTLPPLPEVTVPEYTQFVLDNGMVVYLMEHHELPLVAGMALVRTGNRWESATQVGLARLVGTVMRTGGTQHHSGDKLNQLLEQRAAAVEAGIGKSSGRVNFTALSEDLEMVFGLFAEVVREPVFAAEKLDLAKIQVQGKIARRNDEPDDIVGREFQKLIYGKDSPYARTVEYATLNEISRDDLVSFYQQYFHPNNIILGIVGDFDAKEMQSLIRANFGDWRKAKLTFPEQPPVSQATQEGVFFINQPQLTQSYIEIGHLGGQLDNPDDATLDVMTRVLNGFGGRLFNEVRSRQGLAYSVYGDWIPQFDYPGVFAAGGETRSATTVPFIEAIRSEMKRLQSEMVTPEELAFAKDSVLNSFVFNFQYPSQTLSRLMNYAYYGYPEDFLFRYRRGVEATTAPDIQRVAQKYLKPEKLVILVVGNEAAIEPPLTQLAAEVTPIDITIPQKD